VEAVQVQLPAPLACVAHTSDAPSRTVTHAPGSAVPLKVGSWVDSGAPSVGCTTVGAAGAFVSTVNARVAAVEVLPWASAAVTLTV
jgi:hypothetical protein